MPCRKVSPHVPDASRLRMSGALHLGIPYPVRDKLLNSLQKDFFNCLFELPYEIR